MLDITRFRLEYGGNPEVIRESQRRRGADEKLVDMVVESDSAWRVAQHTLQTLRGDLSKAKAAAHAARKEQQLDEAKRLLDGVKALSVEAAAAAGVEATSHLDVQRHLAAVSNLVHEHAPVRATHGARCMHMVATFTHACLLSRWVLGARRRGGAALATASAARGRTAAGRRWAGGGVWLGLLAADGPWLAAPGAG